MDKYTIDYFIKKFEAIPMEEWTVGDLHDTFAGGKCAYGHCDVKWSSNPVADNLYTLTDEALALSKHLEPIVKAERPGVELENVAPMVNDNYRLFEKYGADRNNPKERIINALKAAKKLKEGK